MQYPAKSHKGNLDLGEAWGTLGHTSKASSEKIKKARVCVSHPQRSLVKGCGGREGTFLGPRSPIPSNNTLTLGKGQALNFPGRAQKYRDPR